MYIDEIQNMINKYGTNSSIYTVPRNPTVSGTGLGLTSGILSTVLTTSSPKLAAWSIGVSTGNNIRENYPDSQRTYNISESYWWFGFEITSD